MEIGDIGRITVGQTVFLVPDRFGPGQRFKESVVRELSTMLGRPQSHPMRYMQLATLGKEGVAGNNNRRAGGDCWAP